jgi:arginine/ornithine transport system permease protein
MSVYFLNILQGLIVTVGVALGALVVSALLGLAGAAAKLSPIRALNWVGDIYSTVIRGVPDLVWMLLLYYGGQIALNNAFEAMGYKQGPQINPFFAGIVTIGFVYGAYMTETFRGAIMSVPKGQSEAGWAFGMSRFYTFRRIVLPQMVRFAMPSFTNNWLVLVKSTALVSLLGLSDITNLAKQSGAAARGEIPGAAILFMTFAAFLYLAITSVSMLILRHAEKKYSAGVKRVQL